MCVAAFAEFGLIASSRPPRCKEGGCAAWRGGGAATVKVPTSCHDRRTYVLSCARGNTHLRAVATVSRGRARGGELWVWVAVGSLSRVAVGVCIQAVREVTLPSRLRHKSCILISACACAHAHVRRRTRTWYTRLDFRASVSSRPDAACADGGGSGGGGGGGAPRAGTVRLTAPTRRRANRDRRVAFV